MRNVHEADIRHLRPGLRRKFLDGTMAYRGQETEVIRGGMSTRYPGQFRDNLVQGPETKERRR